jgi:uncharacterized protein YjbJ (UPF0337 family)
MRALNVTETDMNKDQAEGTWNEFVGKVKQQWSKLTDDDIGLLKGKTQEFYGKVQKEYGISKEEVETKLKEFDKAGEYYNRDQAA